MAEYNGPYIVDPDLQDIMACECSDQSNVMGKIASLMGVPRSTADNWRYKERVKSLPLAAARWAVSLTMAPALLDYWAPEGTKIVECAVIEPPTMNREKELMEVTLAAADFHQKVFVLTSGPGHLSPIKKREIAALVRNLRRQLDEAEALVYKL